MANFRLYRKWILTLLFVMEYPVHYYYILELLTENKCQFVNIAFDLSSTI